MQTTKLSEATGLNLPQDKRGSARIRSRVVAAWKKGERWVRSPLLRIRPRVSLLTGSVFVLVTLYLPTVVGSCGNPAPGYELALGNSNRSWRGSMLVDNSRASRGFYLLCLTLATLTLLLVLASLFRSGLVRKRPLVTWLFAISCAVSLFATTDVFGILVGVRMGQLQDWIGGSGEVYELVFVAIPLLLLVACLRPEFWQQKGAIAWATAVAGVISLSFLADFLPSPLYPKNWDEDFVSMVAPPILFSLVPLGLWLRFGLFWRDDSRPPWQGVRRRLLIFYAITGVFDLLNLATGVGGYWGLLSFFVGMYLILFGYTQLRRHADGQQPMLSSASVQTVN